MRLQLKQVCWVLVSFLLFGCLEAKLPEIDAKGVTRKSEEIMKSHASHKELTPELIRRMLNNYLEGLDPSKAYLTKKDISQWSEPSEKELNKIQEQYQKADFSTFIRIHNVMASAILRRRELEKQIQPADLPKKVDRKEFKDLEWVETPDELVNRIKRIRALQNEVADKLSDDLQDKAKQRIEKYQRKYEDKILDKENRDRLIYANILKAIASSLDAHTNYFTPDEAKQFLIGVQQRLFGIGAQLRDDVTGLTIMKIIEGGPAYRNGQLKVKDRIIAVNGEPIVGMDITDAVELIRGPENTKVTLTVIRQEEAPKGQDKPPEQKVDITIERGEVVLKETRYETSVEPFGDGVIAYLRLFTFYQDPEHSSASDLHRELEKIKEEYDVKGVVFDLRSNSGGLLSQAVSVAGLFITKGVVVSIKDENGKVQHLRDLDGKTTWGGPLVVLVNRASASASEIVAQTLQDYGRAIVIGDESTYGKGSFQTFTLNGSQEGAVNPEGEYKVTRGRYYTVSGHTPQRTGVLADIVVPSLLSQLDIGEKYLKHPLDPDEIESNFDDKLLDIPFMQRARVSQLYRFDLQPKLDIYERHMKRLKGNSELRISNNKNYQALLKEIADKEDDRDLEDEDLAEKYGQNDLQLTEAVNIMKDLIILMHQQ